MSKSILQQLFDGDIYPSENIKPSNPKYIAAKKTLAEEKEYLLKTLSDDDLERFKKIDDLHYETANMYSYACFVHGFRLAVALMFESLNSNNIPLKNDSEK